MDEIENVSCDEGVSALVRDLVLWNFEIFLDRFRIYTLNEHACT